MDPGARPGGVALVRAHRHGDHGGGGDGSEWGAVAVARRRSPPVTGPYVAGVDGGGTRTRVLLLARDGATAGRAEGPAALVRPDRPAAAARVVADTVRRAADAAGVALPLPALWAGLAGAGQPRVRRALEAVLRNERIARAVRVGTDVEAAFHDAFGGGPGIVVVAGTGSVVLGAAV
ncbi:MAG: hypothetical protein F4151_04620, partial [Gammaproteobacteria bacterium]|nr:hypothetical protein [Gammaproteobacteria bacterium]